MSNKLVKSLSLIVFFNSDITLGFVLLNETSLIFNQ